MADIRTFPGVDPDGLIPNPWAAALNEARAPFSLSDFPRVGARLSPSELAALRRTYGEARRSA